jgi:hypothetical protein
MGWPWSLALVPFLGVPPALLVGGAGGGAGAMGRSPEGWFLGADSGWATLIGGATARSEDEFHHDAWCFGARAGYQLASGLAVQLRFDDLGVSAPDGTGTLLFATAGVRYSLPLTVPMPFVEAMVGPAFHGGAVSPSVGAAVGLSLFAGRHVALEATLRDWLVGIDGVHHAPAVMLGVTAGFGG